MSPGKKLGNGSNIGRYTKFVLAHAKHTHSKKTDTKHYQSLTLTQLLVHDIN